MAAIPLWGELNDTVLSDVFHVPAGKCAVLFATGLSEEKTRVSAEEFKGPQMVCVERVGLSANVGDPVAPCDGQCGPASARDMDARMQFSDLVEQLADQADLTEEGFARVQTSQSSGSLASTASRTQPPTT